MISQTPVLDLLATVDVRELSTLRWGPLRMMFPGFVEDIELTRYLRGLLADEPRAVTITPHVDTQGRASRHVFDVYRMRDAELA